jgi:dihydroflavonol-4-reductase
MVVVTGANGLLGRYICQQLLSNNISVIGTKRKESKIPEELMPLAWKDADILEPLDLQEAFQGATTVIHTAALVSFNPRLSEKLYETNVLGTRNVVNACLRNQVSHLIHVSSVAALGRVKGRIILDETCQWTDDSMESDYGQSKHLAELEVYRGYAEGLITSIINPSMIMAPLTDGRSSAQLLDYVWSGNKFYTNGTINYVDVRDVVDSILQLYKSPQPGERFILSAGHTTYQKMFTEIATRFGTQAPSILVPSWAASLAGWIEELKAGLLKQEPLVSRQSARLAKENFQFNNKKAVNQMGIKFKNLSETLDWACGKYRDGVIPKNRKSQ